MNKLFFVIVVLVIIAVIWAIFSVGGNDDLDQAKIDDQMMHNDSSMNDAGEIVEDDKMMDDEKIDEGSMLSLSGPILAGDTTKFYDFRQSDYEKVLASDKLLVLYFYATWCPICKEEINNSLYPAFNEMSDENVIGFRVNYNDGDTDGAEKNLAREHGVAYQHTKVFVRNGERILKSPESWDKNRYLSEISAITN